MAYDIDSADHFLRIAALARDQADAASALHNMLRNVSYGTREFKALIEGVCAVRRGLRETQEYIALSVAPWFEVQR